MSRYGTDKELLRKIMGITEEDIWKIRQFGEFAKPKIDLFLDRYFKWIKEIAPEYYEEFFSDIVTKEKVRKAIGLYWTQFWDGKIDEEYIALRRSVGEVHDKIHLDHAVFLAALSKAYTLWTEELYDGNLDEADYKAAVSAIKRLLNFDIAIVVNVFGEINAKQGRALIELSTPISELWNHVLMLPIIGLLDTKRARDIMENMLAKITESKAKVFIIDISGVGSIDTIVADHLICMTKAAELMGCKAVVSGVLPRVAQTIVKLGIDIGEMRTVGTLHDALHFALEIVEQGFPE